MRPRGLVPLHDRAHRLLPLLAALLLPACGGRSGTGILTVVGAGDGTITQLRVTLSAGGSTRSGTFPEPAAGPLRLPKTVSLTFPRDAMGPLRADVEGLVGGMPVARGSAVTPLSGDHTLLVAIALEWVSTLDGGTADSQDFPDLSSVADGGIFVDSNIIHDSSINTDAAIFADRGTPPGYLNLQTGWMPYSPKLTTFPMVAVTTTSATSVTVSSTGGPDAGTNCSCNGQHLVIPLAASFPCSGATLEFSYATTPASATRATALEVVFLTGKVSDGFYQGSESTGSSPCEDIYKSGTFPLQPQVHEGHNTIALGSLMAAGPARNGSCNPTASFDTIDVYLQASGCGANDTQTTTLSNLRIY